MTDSATDSSPFQTPAGRAYLLGSVLGLVLTFFCLMGRGMTLLALLPCFVGGLSLLLRWGSAGPMYLLVVGGLLFVTEFQAMNMMGFRLVEASLLLDVLLALAAFLFVLCQARWLGLAKHIIPEDPRLRALQNLETIKSRQLAKKKQAETAAPPVHPPTVQAEVPRSASTFKPREFVQAMLLVPLWLLVGLGAWLFFSTRRPRLARRSLGQSALLDFFWGVEFLRALTFLWLLGLGMLLCWAVFSYLRWRTYTPSEAQQACLDIYWQETWREQQELGRKHAQAREKLLLKEPAP